MIVKNTAIEGLKIIQPKKFEDHRGYFFESFNKNEYEKAGIHANWVQDNQSKSMYGVVRGLHYQISPFTQAKLVRVLSGIIFDVAVDIRKDSPTFGQWHGLEISSENNLVFYIPEGFAHGFSVLSEEATVLYKCSVLYHPQAERGILFNDSMLGIDWMIPSEKMVLTGRDQAFPEFSKAEMNNLREV